MLEQVYTGLAIAWKFGLVFLRQWINVFVDHKRKKTKAVNGRRRETIWELVPSFPEWRHWVLSHVGDSVMSRTTTLIACHVFTTWFICLSRRAGWVQREHPCFISKQASSNQLNILWKIHSANVSEQKCVSRLPVHSCALLHFSESSCWNTVCWNWGPADVTRGSIDTSLPPLQDWWQPSLARCWFCTRFFVSRSNKASLLTGS